MSEERAVHVGGYRFLRSTPPAPESGVPLVINQIHSHLFCSWPVGRFGGTLAIYNAGFEMDLREGQWHVHPAMVV